MRAEDSPGKRIKERRRTQRSPKNAKIRISWSADGRERVSQADLLDLSVTGMRLSARDPIPLGAPFRFRVEGIDLHGSATIRHCLQKGLKYTLGAEFLGGLTWKDIPPSPPDPK